MSLCLGQHVGFEKSTKIHFDPILILAMVNIRAKFSFLKSFFPFSVGDAHKIMGIPNITFIKFSLMIFGLRWPKLDWLTNQQMLI